MTNNILGIRPDNPGTFKCSDAGINYIKNYYIQDEPETLGFDVRCVDGNKFDSKISPHEAILSKEFEDKNGISDVLLTSTKNGIVIVGVNVVNNQQRPLTSVEWQFDNRGYLSYVSFQKVNKQITSKSTTVPSSTTTSNTTSTLRSTSTSLILDTVFTDVVATPTRSSNFGVNVKSNILLCIFFLILILY